MGIHPARLEASLLNVILEGLTKPIYRKSVLPALLRANGGFKFNCTQDQYRWKIKYKRTQMQTGDPYAMVNQFSSENMIKEAKLDIRRCGMGLSHTELEGLLAANSKTVFKNMVVDASESLAEDWMESFRLQLYGDGNALTEQIHGLESWFAQDGLITSSFAGNPTDVYGGVQCSLGYYGGSWESGTYWPDGSSTTPQYDFWSPLIVDWNAPYHDTTTDKWENNWQKALNAAIGTMEVSRDSVSDILLMHPKLLLQARNSLIGAQKMEITQHGDLTKLGHKVLNFMGQDIVTEHGVPDATCYLLATRELELRCVQSQLLGIHTDEDIRSLEQLKTVNFYGNLICKSPAHQCKIMKITADT